MITDIVRPPAPRTVRDQCRALTVAAITTLTLAGCGAAAGTSGGAVSPASASAPASPSSSPSPTATAPARARGPLPVAPGAGRLAQTRARPRARGPAFHAMVTDLWLAVRTGRASLGRAGFFPLDAYKQVKAIYDPAADWRSRLWLDFSLDVRAAHRLLGRQARRARLIRVIVPSAGAAWIDPGVCYNKVGYWHVAGPRVVYRVNGQVRSFGIASLISWRGVWYVVHFGGITRPAVGMVDTPTSGPGIPGPQGGC